MIYPEGLCDKCKAKYLELYDIQFEPVVIEMCKECFVDYLDKEKIKNNIISLELKH
jgi:hypothetical protein